jgi:hypothetical protein
MIIRGIKQWECRMLSLPVGYASQAVVGVTFVTVRCCSLYRYLFLNNQPDAQIIQILFCYKTLHVSGIFCAHHLEFSTAHSALVSFMQVSDDCFQAESTW